MSDGKKPINPLRDLWGVNETEETKDDSNQSSFNHINDLWKSTGDHGSREASPSEIEKAPLPEQVTPGSEYSTFHMAISGLSILTIVAIIIYSVFDVGNMLRETPPWAVGMFTLWLILRKK